LIEEERILKIRHYKELKRGRFSSHATQCIEAEEEVEDAPGSGEAI